MYHNHWSQSVAVAQKSKNSFTFISCVLADRSEHVAPLVIGRETSHGVSVERKFVNKVSIIKSKKIWEKQGMFYVWLRYFYSYVGRTPERFVFRLIDKSSAHRKPDYSPTLENVIELFLPANITAQLQNLKAGLVYSIKKYYEKYREK